MVVGAEHVDEPLEPAQALVEVVGDVGSEIRAYAILALDDAVLVIAKGGRPEPQRAVLPVRVALRLEAPQCLVDRARGRERALRVPAIEFDAHVGKIRADVGEHAAERVVEDGAEPLDADELAHAPDDGIDEHFLVAALGGIGG